MVIFTFLNRAYLVLLSLIVVMVSGCGPADFINRDRRIGACFKEQIIMIFDGRGGSPLGTVDGTLHVEVYGAYTGGCDSVGVLPPALPDAADLIS